MVAGILGILLGGLGIAQLRTGGNSEKGIVQIVASVVTCGLLGDLGLRRGDHDPHRQRQRPTPTACPAAPISSAERLQRHVGRRPQQLDLPSRCDRCAGRRRIAVPRSGARPTASAASVARHVRAPRSRPDGRPRAARYARPPCLDADPELFDKVVNLCKRRGFVFPSAEIYGGFRSTYDYGPLGVLMLRNVKDAWWRSMVQLRDDVVGLDAAILRRPPIWEASGHLANFTDPLVDCRNCKERFRLDKLDDPDTCPSCGAKDSFTEARQFNLMFKTHAGPVEDDGAVAYLRPETAQGMFVNFMNVLQTSAQEAAVRHRPDRQVVPQRDHAGQLRLPHPRVRADGDGVLRAARRGPAVVRVLVRASGCSWYLDLGIPEDQLRLRPHDADELSHYSSGTSDVEFLLPVGLGRARGHRQPQRLRPHAARRSTRASGSSTSTRPPTSATCPT